MLCIVPKEKIFRTWPYNLIFYLGKDVLNEPDSKGVYLVLCILLLRVHLHHYVGIVFKHLLNT